MADFTALKTAIQTYIKQNGNEEITGAILQEILLSVVTTLGDGAINDLITALGNEVTARQQADGTLQQNITNEATARGNADTALSNRLGSSITAEHPAAEQIGEEAEAREAADTALQGLIDGITDNIENGYVYAGIATPSSTPTTGKVFYLALTAGTYTNFDSTEVSQGINILKFNGSAWSLDAFIGIDDTPTPNSPKLVKSGGTFDSVMTNGSAFDISAHFASGGTLATYADLDAALAALNTLSESYKRGGMSIKFVLSSDNKYYQFRFMLSGSFTDAQFGNVKNWQSMDVEAVRKIVGDFEDFNLNAANNGYYESDGTIHNDSSYECKEIDATSLKGKIIAYRLGYQIPETQYVPSDHCFLKKNDNSIVELINYKINPDDSIVVVKIPSDASKLLISWTVDTRYTTNPFISYYYTGNFMYEKLQKDINDEIENIESLIYPMDWLNNYYSLTTGELKNGGAVWACTNKLVKQLNINKSLVPASGFISYWNNGTYIGYYQDGKYYNTSGTEISEITDFTKYAINIFKEDLPDYESVAFANNSLPEIDKRVTVLENAEIPSFWKNKKIGFLGDSITEGAYFDAQGGHYTDRPYPLIVGEILGATTINYGDSGTSISGTSTTDPSNSFTHRYSSMANDLDMVVVFGGTNDFADNNGVVLGTPADTTDISFYGAMDVLCRGLLAKYPPKRIVFITPLLRDFVNGGTEGVPNDRGFTIEQVRQAIIDVAQNRYGLYVINGKCLGLSPFSPNKNDYMYDGLHPNPLGYEMLGKNIAHILSAI